MGFNIGVFSEQTSDNFDCHHFIDRAFYNFVHDGEQYGNESILIKSGQYFGLDLSPFLKLVYITEEVTESYIKANIQDIDFILNLTKAFKEGIKNDRAVCDHIKYVWYSEPANFSQADIDKLMAELGEDAVLPFLDTLAKQKKEREENPNPWKWYFEDGQIIEDLNNLIKSLQCYKDKGVNEIYLTAG